MALVLSLVLADLLIPAFSNLTAKPLSWALVSPLQTGLVLLGLLVFICLISGIYPAVLISRMDPVSMFKDLKTFRVKMGLSRTLAVVQYTCTAFLITAVIVMYRQLDFVSHMNLGYNKEQVLVVPTFAGSNDQGGRILAQMRTALDQEPHINTMSGVNASFNRGWNMESIEWKGENPSLFIYRVDPEYVTTMGMEIVAGTRFFVEDGSRFHFRESSSMKLP